MKDIKVVCTWGDGPDVLVALDGSPFLLLESPTNFNHYIHGVVKRGQFDLTADEALELASELVSAANEAKRLDEECEQHDKEVTQ